MTAGDSTGPDLGSGIPLDALPDGEPVFGQVDGKAVYAIRSGDRVSAYAATCTHYGAPLAEGLVRQGIVRCPWHHARFDVRDGRVLGGPACDPLTPFRVRVEEGSVVVTEAVAEPDPLESIGEPATAPDSVVIIGAGAAGTTAAETLRREGYDGPVRLVDADPDAPYDRPNLSKAFLVGDLGEDRLPLRSPAFLADHGIDLVRAGARRVDPERRCLELDGGEELAFGVLLLATGAEPNRLAVDGGDLPHVRRLRTLEDCRGIIDAAERAASTAVIGASFIGMEVAASLRARGLAVTVVAPEETPFENTLGGALGTMIRTLHEAEGVEFRLGRTVERIEPERVHLDDGEDVRADLVVVGVGVRPRTELAAEAGLDVDDGILVDEYLRTSADGVWAAGDVARYPHRATPRGIRIEHWVVAGRQGRTAARNILGCGEPFDDVPFFWTRQFGRSVLYVGHAGEWDEQRVDGNCGDGDCGVSFLLGGERRAFVSVGRSDASLEAEAELESESRPDRPTAHRGPEEQRATRPVE